MTPSQTKLMEQCRAEAEAKYPDDLDPNMGQWNYKDLDGTEKIYASAMVLGQRKAYAQALFDERSKRPTVEQVMEVVKGYRTGVKPQSLRAVWMCEIEHEDLRSRLTKLLGEK